MANRLHRAWNALIGAPEQAPIEQKESSGPWTYDELAAWMRNGTATTPETYQEIVKTAYELNVVGYKCVNLVATGVGGLNFYLKQKGQIVEGPHPLLKLLQRPNPTQGKGAFFTHVQGAKLLDGNSFIEMVGPSRDGVSRKAPPRELWTLCPANVTVNMTTQRLPQSYTYSPGSVGAGTAKTYAVNPTTGECQLLHLMAYSPLYETEMGKGLSPAKSVWLSLLTHTESQRWNNSLLKNGARPSGAFVTGKGTNGTAVNLTPDQLASLKAQVTERYAGSANSGKPMLLDGGLDWREMSLSPKDMDFVEAKNSAARDIALAFGVPPLLLNIPGDSTYSNYKEARMALYEDTILPAGYALCDELNRWLVPMFGDDLELCIDEDAISALEPKREMKWTRANTSTFLTINEKREMVGYDDIGPVGDEVLVPTSVLPLGASLDEGAGANEGA